MRIGESFVRTGGTDFDSCQDNELSDNHIHHVGQVYAPGVGVLVLFTARNRVVRNEIDHLSYSGISMGWCWGYDSPQCAQNLVEGNSIHDIGQSVLSDLGGIYTLGPQPGTVIRNNIIHNVSAYSYGGWGLYADQGSSYILWESNVVFRTQSASFFLHYGKENIVRNNILAFSKELQVQREQPEVQIPLVFTNNIIYCDSGKLLNPGWPLDGFLMDFNIFYDTRGTNSILFGNRALDQWRQLGYDVHSVICDPGFADVERCNFALSPTSPAALSGFGPINLNACGPRAVLPPSYLRTAK
jgi:hypothetical protein